MPKYKIQYQDVIEVFILFCPNQGLLTNKTPKTMGYEDDGPSFLTTSALSLKRPKADAREQVFDGNLQDYER